MIPRRRSPKRSATDACDCSPRVSASPPSRAPRRKREHAMMSTFLESKSPSTNDSMHQHKSPVICTGSRKYGGSSCAAAR